jgi:hypothetical protein
MELTLVRDDLDLSTLEKTEAIRLDFYNPAMAIRFLIDSGEEYVDLAVDR